MAEGTESGQPTPLPTPGGPLSAVSEEPDDIDYDEWDNYLTADMEAEEDVRKAYFEARADLSEIFGGDCMVEAEDSDSEGTAETRDILEAYVPDNFAESSALCICFAFVCVFIRMYFVFVCIIWCCRFY